MYGMGTKTYRGGMYGWIGNPRHIETTCMYGLGIQNIQKQHIGLDWESKTYRNGMYVWTGNPMYRKQSCVHESACIDWELEQIEHRNVCIDQHVQTGNQNRYSNTCMKQKWYICNRDPNRQNVAVFA